MRIKLLGRKSCLYMFTMIFSCLLSVKVSATSIWVGETIQCDATSSVMGLTSDVSWTTSGGYLSLSGSGFYRNVTATQYWSGTATVKCTWKYRLYAGDTWRTQSKTWTFTCTENPVSIYPTSMTLSVGETGSVGYSHKYSNSYVSAANVYYSSSNPTVATVSNNGQVTGVGTGTCYITVYSKLSNAANAPSCRVTVEDVAVQSVTIPSSIEVVAGETKTVSKTVSPSNAVVTSTSWTSNNPSIATINSSGVLTGISHGTTSIYCTVNGNIRSNSATVTVSKPTLSLTASRESGLVEKGTTVRLTASYDKATIYYTTNGTTPSSSSQRYTAPISIDKNMTLKAIASHEDYKSSSILTRNFETTELKTEETYPQQSSAEVSDVVKPSVTYNDEISQNDNYGDIKLIHNGASEVAGEVIIYDKTLYFVPETPLQEGSYVLEIPQKAISSRSLGANMATDLTFTVVKYVYPIMVDVGTSSMVAVKNDGSLWNWGRVYNSEDSFTVERIPRKYDKLCDVKFAIERYGTIAAIKHDGSLWTWGSNVYGQLGNGGSSFTETPIKVAEDVKSVAVDSHLLVLKNDGTVWTCGYNASGQLGNGTSSTDENPVLEKVAGLSNVVAVNAGWHTSAAIKDDGSLWTWGAGGWLGDGTEMDRTSPVKIMTDVRQVCLYLMGGYAVKNDNTLWEWHGLQLTPKKILDDIKQISATNLESFIIKTDDSLWGWGYNDDGELGTGTTTKEYISYDEAVKIMDDVSYVSSDGSNTSVIKTDGSLWTWGSNYSNCVGNDSDEDQLTPVKIMEREQSIPLDDLDCKVRNIDMEVGQKAPMQLILTPYNAYYTELKYRSRDETVATISDNGVVTGVSQGTAILETTINDEKNGKRFTMVSYATVSQPTGIEQVVDNGNEVSGYYDINGYRYETPQKGFNIVRYSDGTTKKVIVR